jgi:hypothetical protein
MRRRRETENGHSTYFNLCIAFTAAAGIVQLDWRSLRSALDDSAQIVRKLGRVPIMPFFMVVLDRYLRRNIERRQAGKRTLKSSHRRRALEKRAARHAKCHRHTSYN